MKKIAIVLLAVGFAGVSAQAAAPNTYSCYGVGENKGGAATLEFANRNQNYRITGTEVTGAGKNKSYKLQCSGVYDKNYKPRTPNPKLARFSANRGAANCTYDTAMISKDIISTGQGYINLSVECGPDGDTCEAAYFCKR